MFWKGHIPAVVFFEIIEFNNLIIETCHVAVKIFIALYDSVIAMVG